ncbi:50S ribosomal protein L17 [Helicobacter sp. MIT 14-3879]|uniref:50S ribosomal protein L17 n=1 Tax=Helicobacter sp. MIT 14-3879 TaxID=2040649 RepID=UPI000E1E60F5|nr:50S ribosomal protein L17 [Helicobacter sp. MIT 14-3879]RDU64141.1 50S ribosomal protein L17 [Helicobacter sp. MIT 14-3879]
MRHSNDYRKLGRTSSHRKALLKNLSISLIKYEKIKTGLFKSKELQSHIEKLITQAKVGDSNAHRQVFAKLQDKSATKKLVTEIAPRFSSRSGGYTSIHRVQNRKGDASPMAIIGFVGQ